MRNNKVVRVNEGRSSKGGTRMSREGEQLNVYE